MDNNNQIYCGECHKPLQNLAADGVIAISRNGKKSKLLCASCLALLSTCARCKNYTTCSYQSYTGPEPKIVNKTIRQGNMVMQTQIPNPEVIDKTCDKCLCNYPDLGCMRQQGYCGNLFVEGWDELPTPIQTNVSQEVSHTSSSDEVANSNNDNIQNASPTVDTTNEEVSTISDTMREASQDETHDPDEDSSIAPQPHSQENTNAAENPIE